MHGTQVIESCLISLHNRILLLKVSFCFAISIHFFTFSGIASKAVEILAEDDFPPSAKVSAPQVLTLPENKVTLYGNETKDDHGIVKYVNTVLLQL